MSAGFTPGPWEVHNGYLIRKCEGDFCTAIAEMRAPYRKGVSFVRAYKQEWANARLIAAAPELYDALELVLDTYGFDSSTDSSIWQTVVAALAKARGEQA